MNKFWLVCVLAVCFLLSGCCNNPGVFAKIDASQRSVQSAYYDAKGQSTLPSDQYVALGGAAADAALALGGMLQKQWCPSQADADALADQVKSLPLVK